MIECPHCDYKDGYAYDADEGDISVDGDEGSFFRFALRLEREHPEGRCYSDQKAKLFGCPKCSKTFINLKYA